MRRNDGNVRLKVSYHGLANSVLGTVVKRLAHLGHWRLCIRHDGFLLAAQVLLMITLNTMERRTSTSLHTEEEETTKKQSHETALQMINIIMSQVLDLSNQALGSQ